MVLAAVSGGADSLALAAALAFVAPRLGLRAGAVLVDHGLQPGSGAVANSAADTCRGLGLDPVRVVPVRVHASGHGPEAAARTARYAALEAAADELGAAGVLLGHTREDQAESVLLGVARGSGTRSLAGMGAVRGRWWRPLLDVSHDTTRAACAALGLRVWQDPHNLDARYTRVRARAALERLERDLGPGVVAGLARTAALAGDDADALDALAAAAYDDLSASVAERSVDLEVDALRALAPAVRRRVLRLAAAAVSAGACGPSSTQLAALEALVSRWHGRGEVALPAGVRAGRYRGRLHLRHCGRLLPVDAGDMGADLDKVLISEQQIHERLGELAAQIDSDYAGRDLLLVGVLKGAVMVMADLARALRSKAEMDWMAVSSYGSGTKSSGVVRILKDLDRDVTGQDILIVEDVVDSGLTLSWLMANLHSRGPASVEVCTLLRKQAAAKVEVDVRYVGFDIDPDFVVGYGLDYAQKYRNLPFVATLAPHVYS